MPNTIKSARECLGKTVRFTARCGLFPKAGITGKLIALDFSRSNELLYILSVNGRRYTVGANTDGLKMEALP